MKRIVLATGNNGKVQEFSALLSHMNWNIQPQTALKVAEIAETGLTFIENAILKARHAAQQTGLPAIADDSGLVVDALLGAPGIYSARYAGEAASDSQNIEKLLHALQDVADSERTAHFQCVLVYLEHPLDPSPLVCQGSWQGKIALRSAGTGGFGYDPVFYIPELNCTAAELTRQQKSIISHRGQAIKKLIAALTHD